jgi:hypothetical protein
MEKAVGGSVVSKHGHPKQGDASDFQHPGAAIVIAKLGVRGFGGANGETRTLKGFPTGT